MRLTVRDAKRCDYAGIEAIINHEIASGTIRWATTLMTPATVEAWVADRQDAGRPFFVCVEATDDDDEIVLGYATYGDFRKGEGYEDAVENSVYVAEAAQRRGIGTALMDRLINRAREDGVYIIVAGCSGTAQGSIALHTKLGFEKVAHIPRCGSKHGQRLDLLMFALYLQDDDGNGGDNGDDNGADGGGDLT